MNDLDLFGEKVLDQKPGVLCEAFEYPPFSVLSARDGWWAERKRKWLAMGIKSELGRGDDLTGGFGTLGWAMGQDAQKGEEKNVGTSIFDPVLCELLYRWFCPSGGRTLDPFAGGSVRGVVAGALGVEYHGIELRPEQVEANREQAGLMGDYLMPRPLWNCDDARNASKLFSRESFDFIMSCPPYGDLEIYSDDERDISNMTYADFRRSYSDIIYGIAGLLKPDRFAAFVVGDFRDKKGFMRGFPSHTIEAFESAGLRYYNEAILMTPAGSLPVRTGKQFTTSRKMGKTHQNVLVFCKGDPRAAASACNGAGA